MATTVIMPKQGNTVESCIVVEWKKAAGDDIVVGDVLCEVETDKATLEVESTAAGTLLALFFDEGDEVPVMTPIAAVGRPGEDISALRPDYVSQAEPSDESVTPTPETALQRPTHFSVQAQDGATRISPRAKGLARQKGLDAVDLAGTGPAGRIIERDIEAALAGRPRLTPVAERMLKEGDFRAPARGTGSGGRVTVADLIPAAPEAPPAQPGSEPPHETHKIPLSGIRKVIAERMLDSLQTTAQLTLNSSADARALLAYRQRLKESPEALGLQGVTINDLILFAVSRTLARMPEMNALFDGQTITQFQRVHLASAVDTPRGLMVPVIRNADLLSLRQISVEAKRLANACLESRITPDELSGGTFTVSNLGVFGVESFTPILNPPQVAILGVGNVNLKPVSVEGEVQFVPHIGLSLTINHQIVDGAPGARFLQALAQNLVAIDLLAAV